MSRTVARVTGSATTWARDFALVGAASGFFALVGVFGLAMAWPAALAAAAGAGAGAALGAALPPTLDRLRGRLRLPVIGGLLLPVGFAWGALSGWAAAASFMPGELDLRAVLICVAGIAGAIQLGWLWFPYAFQTVRGGRTWPLVAAACLTTPLLGYAASTVFMWGTRLL